MHGDGTSLAVAVHEGVFAPSLLVGTYAASAYHLSHRSGAVIEQQNINKFTFSSTAKPVRVGRKHNGGVR